jgi:adenylate cyclase
VIEPALAQAERERLLRKPPDRLDAWEAYQRGLWHFYRYGPEDNQIAQAFFRQAIALDPNFAPSHYGYSLALYWDSWLYSTRPFNHLERIEHAEARLAVSLDDKDATAHAVLAIMMCVVGDWEESVLAARTALALNPNSVFVLSTLGLVLGRAGYHEEAIRRLRQAMRASLHDPLTWQWLNGIADFQLFSGDFEAALETYRQVMLRRPQFFSPHLFSAAALAYLGGRVKPEMHWRAPRHGSPNRSNAGGIGHPGPVRKIGRSKQKAFASQPPGSHAPATVGYRSPEC